MKKITIIIGLVVVIGIGFLAFTKSSQDSEYDVTVWKGNGQYVTSLSSTNLLKIGDSKSETIITAIQLDQSRKLHDVIVNPARQEIYVLLNDPSEIGGPYIGASVYVIAYQMNGQLIKELALLDGYDLPNASLSVDGQRIHVEQLIKSGNENGDVVLEKFDLDIAKLLSE